MTPGVADGRTMVALSGGVDSSVAAALLAAGGTTVVGVTMRLWGGESDTGCCSVADVEDARRAAAQVGIEHHVFNFAAAFEERVVAPYVADHAAGRTPNPCVECNRHLKFDQLLRRARVLGFDVLATGHHARLVRDARGRLHLARGRDLAKDQSYVLHPVLGTDLEALRFPVGELTKGEVRRIAADRGLRTATKAESQDVCFITRSEGRRRFLEQRVELHPGRIVDTSGRQVGEVDAVELVTVGQRRGLDLAGGGGRRFVTEVDVATRTVTVGGHDDLAATRLELAAVRWAPDGPGDPGEGCRVAVQTSAHGAPAPGRLRSTGADTAVVELEAPVRRVAAGQSVVAYHTVATASGEDVQAVLAGGVAAR